jgi:hypothetical protein
MWKSSGEYFTSQNTFAAFFAFSSVTPAQFEQNNPVSFRFALRKEHGLRVFENRMLGQYYMDLSDVKS